MEKIKCRECSELFTPTNKKQHFCTVQHRWKWHKRNQRNRNKELGNCTQCGKEMVKAIPRTVAGEPKHCLTCQEYYKNLRKKKLQ